MARDDLGNDTGHESGEETVAAREAAYRDAPTFHAQAHGHDLTFVPNGPERMEALLSMIGAARESLQLVFYIFARDESGRRVRDALAEAARRGVAVTVIVDGFGATADAAFFAPLIEAGGRFEVFMANFTRRYLIRNHQKIMIADGRAAMLGGFNIENRYFAPPGHHVWTDLAVRVEGPVVDRICKWFDELLDWLLRPKAQFRSIMQKVDSWEPGEGPVRLLIGGPSRALSDWVRSIGRDLARGSRLDMIMAFFSPPPRLRKRIGKIAKRGQARLVMAGRTDNGATIGASRALYGQLLNAGAKIYEFQPSKLHTKLIVVDEVVYLGSSNFDMRSLYLNLEVMLRIEDAALAEKMRELVTRHTAASQEITRDYYRKLRSPFAKARWWASWFLVSVVDYTVSRKLNLGLQSTQPPDHS